MSNTIVRVYTAAGRLVGYFIDPQVDIHPDHYFQVTGRFVDADGQPLEKLQFNPQSLPYTLDLSGLKKCEHATVSGGYIQRGRHPVVITANCHLG